MPLPKMSDTRYRFQPCAHLLCCRREMTLIKPLCLLTHTNVRWKRLLSAPELPSAVELASSTAMPAAAIHHVFLAFIPSPFSRTLPEATPRARVLPTHRALVRRPGSLQSG
jgi:hypothetical protein